MYRGGKIGKIMVSVKLLLLKHVKMTQLFNQIREILIETAQNGNEFQYSGIIGNNFYLWHNSKGIEVRNTPNEVIVYTLKSYDPYTPDIAIPPGVAIPEKILFRGTELDTIILELMNYLKE